MPIQPIVQGQYEIGQIAAATPIPCPNMMQLVDHDVIHVQCPGLCGSLWGG